MMLARLAPQLLRRELRTHLERGTMNAGSIVLSWETAAVPADRNVEGDYAAAVRSSATIKALIHYVSVKAANSQWTMYQAGDVIVTFDVDGLDPDGKRTVIFTLPDGLDYTQQNTDRDPVEFWSVFVGGGTLTKTLLLRRREGGPRFVPATVVVTDDFGAVPVDDFGAVPTSDA